MKVFGIFYGGRSYSTMVTNRDVESFDSIDKVKGEFRARACGFVRRFPCTDETAELHVFFSDPRNEDMDDESLIDPGYPDRIIKLGKRRGILMERC